jgi:hypothetical protein
MLLIFQSGQHKYSKNEINTQNFENWGILENI